MPLNGRNFIALAQLSDAVVIPPGGTRGEALQQAGPLPNVGGQRSGHNIYLLDGVKVTDELFNNLVINPSVDSIQEFKIQKSMYRAGVRRQGLRAHQCRDSRRLELLPRQRSSNSGATTSSIHRTISVRRGSRSLRFGRTSSAGRSAGRSCATARSFSRSYERLRMERSLTRGFSVPSMAARAGDFAGFAPICDPLTIPTTGTCTPFANNRIPEERIDPIAAGLLAHVPPPTSTRVLRP